MTLAIIFWILMLLHIVFGFWGTPRTAGVPFYRAYGSDLLLFVLLLILGWAAFGSPIKQG